MAKGSTGQAANACRALGASSFSTKFLQNPKEQKLEGENHREWIFSRARKKKIKKKNEIVLKRVTQKRC